MKVTKICHKCGKLITYDDNWKETNDIKSMIEHNKCWDINLGRAEYGSKLDMCNIKFTLCDTCLEEFIETFKRKDIIYDSSNTYFDDLKAYNKNIMKGE